MYWVEPDDGGSSITGYVVFWKTASEADYYELFGVESAY
jgi:hypothetical protein